MISKKDNIRDATNYEQVGRDIKSSLLAPILQTKGISVAIINQTNLPIDVNDIIRYASVASGMHFQIGSMSIRFNYRIVKNWSAIDPNPDQRKDPAQEWLENRNIGMSEIIMEVVEENVVTIRATGTPSPAPVPRVNVYIPPILLDQIAKGVITSTTSMAANDSYPQAEPVFHPRLNQWDGIMISKVDSTYNKTRDRIYAAQKIGKGVGLNSKNVADFTAKYARPFVRLDAKRLNKHFSWITKQAQSFSEDISILPITASSNLSKGIKTVGTVGGFLSGSVIGYKLYTDTWTASTIADTGLLALGAIGAVIGTIASASIVAVAISMICVAYSLIDLYSDNGISDLWNSIFPRNKPFSLPISHFIN